MQKKKTTKKRSLRAFVVFTNGKNGTIGRQIPFKVLPMVPLVIKIKLRSFKCNEHIYEKGYGPYRGFGYSSLFSDP